MVMIGRRFLKAGTGSDDVILSAIPNAPDSSRVALTNAAQTVAGLKTFSSVPKTSGTPSANDDLATVAFLMNAINAALVGLSWQSAVTALCIDADTLTPTAGMRILVVDPTLAAGGVALPAVGDAFEGQGNKIAVRNSGNTEWSFLTPSAGWAVNSLSDNYQYQFNSDSEWVVLGATSDIPDATTSSKGKVQIGAGLKVVDGVISIARHQVKEVLTPVTGQNYLDVAKNIVSDLKEETELIIDGAPAMVYGVAYQVIVDGADALKRVSWAGLGLADLLTSSDQVSIKYWTDDD